MSKSSRTATGWWILLILCACAGTALVLDATARGVGVSPDSTVYIGMARNWLSRLGFNLVPGTGGDVMPIFPALLAIGGIPTGDPAIAARWLNALFFAGNIVLVGILLRQLLPGAFLAPLLGACLMLSAVDMLTIHAMAWTEPAFLFFASSALLLLARYLERPTLARLVLASVAVAAALLTRYIGLALLATGIIALLVYGPDSRREKARAVSVLTVIAGLPFALRILYRPSASRLVLHPPTSDYFGMGWNTIVAWIVPGELPMNDLARQILAVGIASVVAIGALVAWRLLARDGLVDSRQPLMLSRLLVLFLPWYAVSLLVAKFLFRGSIPLDSRLLAPVFVVALVLLISSLHRLIFSVTRWQRVFQSGYTVLAVGLVLIYLYAGVTWVRQAQSEGLGYASRDWQESEIISRVKELPEGTRIYSNGSDAIYYLTGRRAIRIPAKFSGMNLIANSTYQLEMRNVAARLVEGDAVVVYMQNFPERWYQPTEQELRQELALVQIIRARDGAIYRAAP